jgi:hypothetical protein
VLRGILQGWVGQNLAQQNNGQQSGQHSDAGQATEVLLEITPSDQIFRIVLADADGATTEFRFAGWKENVEMSDDSFRFTPPAGVETVEGALLP